MSNNKNLIGNLPKGLTFVLSAPAGTGKTTLISRLKEEFPSVVQSISCTSRKLRGDEVDGVDYTFLSDEEFEKKIESGDFLEYVTLYGHYYGTDKKWVENELNKVNHVFLVIDTQGAMKLKGKYPATFIFVKPPSMDELRRRIEDRQVDSQEMIETRLDWANEEFKKANNYDYIIVNENLDTAYEILKSIVIAEEHRNRSYGV